MRLDDQGGRAAHGEIVVGESPRAEVRLEPADENARAGGRAARRTRTKRIARLAVLVVADQQDVAIRRGKAAMPSIAFGVGNPSSMGSPSLLITR